MCNLYFSYEAEIQFVHYKSSYNNFTDAVDDNQTDSLAIIAVFIAEGSLFGDDYLSFPEAVTELMTQAAALSREEIDTALEMNVTLDQLVSNIGYLDRREITEQLLNHVLFLLVDSVACTTMRDLWLHQNAKRLSSG